MTKHSHFPYTSTYSFTPHISNRKHNIHHIPYGPTQTYNNTLKLKHYLHQRPLHNKHSHRPPTHSHYNTHKTNMRHIHTSIVSRHLATRGNGKILRIPPPHISNSEEILPRFIRRTLAQLRTSISPFLKSYLNKVDAKSHPTPRFPLYNTHTHNVYNLFNCTHICTTLPLLDLWGPRRRNDTAGQMDGEAGRPQSYYVLILILALINFREHIFIGLC